jgi:glucokinase
MYLGVDVGGSKVLVASLTNAGVIKSSMRFPTPRNYNNFLIELEKCVNSFTAKDFVAGAVGMPVSVFDREHGIGVSFSNLPWRNVAIQSDLERIFNCPVEVENDAKLACLSEAMLLKDSYEKVLYVTISTGIGYAMAVSAKLDTSFGDGGGRTLMLEHEGKLVPWESFASGRAIVDRYGKMAKDITDESTWRQIAHDLSLGFLELIAIFEPDIIVVGGSVGTYFKQYGKFIKTELLKYHLPLVPIPPIIGAQRPEEAVVYGCYDIAKEVYGNVTA